MLALGSCGVFAGPNTVNATPSRHTRPLNVPNHRYPSGVYTIAVAEFSGRPFSVSHVSMR